MSTPQQSLTVKQDEQLYESLALRGDISGLNAKDKARYYGDLCTRLGLDPYTQPFIPLKLNGKEILYASRGATDQLARKHCVTRQVTNRERIEDVYVVTVRASLPNGRYEESVGAVTIGQLKSDALANALMKAETKAKRRATLAILGLGLLDEVELETIPDNKKISLPAYQDSTEETVETVSQSEPDEKSQAILRISNLCKQLNDLGVEPKWTPAELSKFINEKYEITEGIHGLSQSQLCDLEEFFKESVSAQPAF